MHLSGQVAAALGLDDEAIGEVEQVALLHDIGKLDAYRRIGDEIEMTDAGRLHGEIALGYSRIRDAIVRTPTFVSRTLSQITGATVYLKFENLIILVLKVFY